jgi:hypothetical protein
MAKAILPPTDPRFQNLVGHPPFGRLTVLAYVGKDKWNHSLWRCRCDCGTEITVDTTRLKSGHTTSCGCARRLRTKTRGNQGNRTHGGWDSPEWRIWLGMIRRCSDSKTIGYERYGGAGITVCDRWLKFPAFLGDMGLKPSPSHTLDRIDGTKGYSPDNCRWATRTEQAVNRRSTRFLTFNGRTMPISHWAAELGISPVALSWRLSNWPTDRAFQPKS